MIAFPKNFRVEQDPSFSETLSTEFQPRKEKKKPKNKVLFSLFKASFFYNIFSSLAMMIVMQQFNDKNILIFYYTAARS